MSNKFRRLTSISPEQLAAEWDLLADERHKQISQGLDITFHHVMSPMVRGLVGEGFMGTLVDVGSGTGELTKKLAPQFNRVVCVEPSFRSVEIAKKVLRKFDHVEFENVYLEKCARVFGFERDVTFLASMVMSADPDLEGFVASLSKMAPEGARFVATIPHPSFWPRYWGYDKEKWFNYKRELLVQAPFKISLAQSSFWTTHVHRPLEKYIEVMSKNGFRLDALREPMPDPIIQSFYPKEWEYPRFIGLRWVKV